MIVEGQDMGFLTRRMWVCVSVVTLFVQGGRGQQMPAPDDWKDVASALGKSGAVMPGGVYKVGLPRTDLQVTAEGVKIAPPLALGSWVAFTRMGSDGMVMGDLVLLETEVNPVMTKLQEGGIEITALHNHLLEETPHVMYMHIGGHGRPAELAAVIHAALALSKTPFRSSPGAKAGDDPALDAVALDKIMGRRAGVSGSVLQYSYSRAEKIVENGMEVPSAMGIATGINFEPTGGGRAAVTGDFVLTSREVEGVIRTLHEHGIQVTALHSHMLDEEPRLFFLHFWGDDDAAKLAAGLRAALDKTNSVK